MKYQFGSSPGVVYQDGTFTIKTLLHTRHNHNLPTYVAFVELVKAVDTVDHTLMLQILKKYGAPPEAPFLHSENVPGFKSRSQDWENQGNNESDCRCKTRRLYGTVIIPLHGDGL